MIKKATICRMGLFVCALGLLGVVWVTGVFDAQPVSAVTNVSGQEILKKALVKSLNTCYSGTYIEKSVSPTKWDGSDTPLKNIFTSAGKKDGLIAIPNYAANTIVDGDLSCYEVFAGYHSSKTKNSVAGLFELFGKNFSATSSGSNNINLVGFGYTTEDVDSGKVGVYSYTISYSYYDTRVSVGPKVTDSVTIKIDSNGRIVENPVPCQNTPDGLGFCIQEEDIWAEDGIPGGWLNVLGLNNGVPDINLAAGIYLDGTTRADISAGQFNTNCDHDPIDTANGEFYSCTDNYNSTTESATVRVYTLDNVKSTFEQDKNSSQTIAGATYTIDNYGTAKNKFLASLGASAYNSDWTKDEKYSLYYNYYIVGELKANSGKLTFTTDPNSCVTTMSAQFAEHAPDYYIPDGGKWCKVKISNDIVISESITDNKGRFTYLTSNGTAKTSAGALGLKTIIRELMRIGGGVDISDSLSADDAAASDTNPSETYPGGSSDSNADDNESTGDDVPFCYNEAKSLGWILCPVLKAVGGGVQVMYEFVEGNFLVVQSEWIQGAKSVWAKFRNYANILFAVMFIIVILSQLTGIGISNYGVKKILPRLIMVVVLVNLSFVLCQIAVDISNILGDGLESLLSEFGADPNGIKDYTGSNIVASIMSTLGLGAAVAGGITIAAMTWEFWLPALLLALIGAAVGIFFAMLILGMRQAAVIILVAISPVAIVCYALPNTKSLFDKWVKVFKAVLVVYPITGALMGGGQLASRLLVVAGNDGANFFLTLIAMLSTIVPFFFIPTLVRKALDGIGGIGSAVSRFGGRFGQNVQRAIGASNGFRDMKRNLGMRNDARTFERYDRRLRNGRTLNEGQLRRMNSARMRYEKGAMEDLDAAANAGKELARPGTARYEALRTRASQKARDDDATGVGVMLTNGTLTSYRRDGHQGGEHINANNFDVNDEQSIAHEHKHLMNMLDQDLSENERNDVETRLRAVQNELSKSAAGQNAMTANFRERITDANSRLDSDSGVAVAARHLTTSGLASGFKNDNRQLYNLANNLSSATAQHVSQDGYERMYAGAGANEYRAESFARMDEQVVDDIYSSMAHGNMSSEDIRKYTELANAALSDSKISNGLQNKVKDKLRKIAGFGYASGAVTNTSSPDYGNYGVATAGSTDLTSAGAGSLESVSKYMSTYGSGSSDAPSRDVVQGIAENARRALRSGEVMDQETVDGLQRILRTADGLGVADASGKKFGQVESTAFRVRGQEAVPMEKRAASFTSQYRSGAINGMGSSSPIDLNNTNALRKEYDSLISEYAINPSNTEALARAQGLQTIMQESSAGQMAMSQVLSSKIAEVANNVGGTTNLQNALADVVGGVSGDTVHMKISRDNQALGAMISDISQHNFKVHTVTPGAPAATAADVRTTYNVRSAGNLTGDIVARMSSDDMNRFRTGMTNNAYDVATTQNIVQSMSDALAHHSSAMNGTTRLEAQSVIASAFSNDKVVHGGGSTTMGTKAILGAPPSAVRDAAIWVKSVNGGQRFSSVPTSGNDLKIYRQLQHMSQNAASAIHDVTATSQQQEAASELLDAIKNIGVTS